MPNKSNLIILLKISILIFCVELLEMVGLPKLGIANNVIISVIDAVVLVSISSPLIYLWVIKPSILARVRTSEEMLRTMFEMSPLGIARNAMDGRYIEVNPSLIHMVGYTFEELQRLSYWDLTPKEYADQEALQLESLEKHKRYGPYEKEYIHRDGHRFPVRLNGVLITGSDGEKYIWSIVEDITQQKLIEKELRESRYRWEFALEGSGAGVWDRNLETGEITLSDHYKALYGYAKDELKGGDEWESHVHPEDKPIVIAAVNEFFEGISPTYSFEYRMQCKDGSWKWINDRGMVVRRDANGKPLRMIGTHTDITDRILLQKELENQARLDYLTGLSNRRYFIEQASIELSRIQRHGGTLSVCMLDIDHFKKVNDTYGHKTGDAVIRKLADLCREHLRKIDIVGRLGGEEFAIILPETDGTVALEVVERLLKTIEKAEVPLETGLPLTFTASMGLTTLAESSNVNVDTLLNQADQALYQAKNSGRNRVCVFNNLRTDR